MLGLTFDSQEQFFSLCSETEVMLPNYFYSNLLYQWNKYILCSKRLRTGMYTCFYFIEKPLQMLPKKRRAEFWSSWNPWQSSHTVPLVNQVWKQVTNRIYVAMNPFDPGFRRAVSCLNCHIMESSKRAKFLMVDACLLFFWWKGWLFFFPISSDPQSGHGCRLWRQGIF